MNFALDRNAGVQAAPGYCVINADGEPRGQGIAMAKAVFDAWVLAVEGVDHVSNEFALNGHPWLTTGQVTHGRGDEHNRHGNQALVEIAFQRTGGEIGKLVIRRPVAA